MQRMFFLIAILLLISCEENEPQFKILRGEAFGTTYSIQYYSSASFSAERGIDSVIHAVNKSVSTYMPNSDISKINRGDSTLVVDAIFKDVFHISETVFTNSSEAHYIQTALQCLRRYSRYVGKGTARVA